MDITLIPITDVIYDKKHKKNLVSDGGIVQLSDCALVLMHKSGLRPLYLLEDNSERCLFYPEQHKTMSQPDLILFSNTEAGTQSAFVIQEQLENCSCPIESRKIDFSKIDKITNLNILRNAFSRRVENLQEKGFKHVVIVAESERLNKIASCMNQKGLNSNHNIPIYSFSNGQEIKDVNLLKNLYITRELLDNYLMTVLKSSKNTETELDKFKEKCNYTLEPYLLRKRIHSLNNSR